MKGTVKWFNTQKGYGFIVGDDGTDYFVHYSNIKVSEFRHLDAGDHVEFDVETNDKGIQAINVVPVLSSITETTKAEYKNRLLGFISRSTRST